MKKFLMLASLFAFTAPVFSQTIDDIDKMVILQQYPKAKTSIDAFMADPKNANKADGWYYKGRIYNSLSYDSTLPKADAYNLKTTAYEAFLKAQTLDAKDTRLKTENYQSYLDLYYGFYDLGAQQFNKKDFNSSFNAFKKALDIRDYMTSKNYSYPDAKLPAFDTALVLNTAVAATQAKMIPEAVTYYTKIVDANVGGPGYEEIYGFLVENYAKKKDVANFNATISKARAKYPNDPYWDELELSMIPKDADKTALFAKYDELIARNPDNYGLSYNASVEYYNSLYGNDARPKDLDAAKARLTSLLKGAIKNDKGIDATVLLTNHLYNVAADYSSAASMIKGTKPEDVKKKNELKKQANAAMDEAIPYADAAMKWYAAQPTLKASQKANRSVVIGYLIDMYGVKGDKVKVAEYEKQKAALN